MIQTLEEKVKGRDIWIFGSRKGNFFDDNSKYLYLYVLKNCSSIFPVWMTKNDKIHKQLIDANLPVVLVGSSEANYCMTVAKAAFICIIYMDIDERNLRKDTKVIQLWHGTPMKQNNIANFRQRYDLVSLASALFLKEQSLGPHEQFNFQLTGYPRNDFLLNQDSPVFLSNSTRKTLEHKKVITFLPTYSEEIDENKVGDKRGKAYNIWEGLNFNNLENFLIENDAVFVIKLHALQSRNTDCETQIKIVNSEHFIFVDSEDPLTDVYCYLKYTDVLITDYSSVLFDYLLLDKPVIFSCFDLELYQSKRNLRFEYEAITPGPKTENWQSVISELRLLLIDNIDQYSNQRSIVNKIFNYHRDSLSCSRIVNHTYNLLGKKNVS